MVWRSNNEVREAPVVLNGRRECHVYNIRDDRVVIDIILNT